MRIMYKAWLNILPENLDGTEAFIFGKIFFLRLQTPNMTRKISGKSNTNIRLTLGFVPICAMFISCSLPTKEDVQPFADAFRSAVTAYTGLPTMNEQQQADFNRRWEENQAIQRASKPTGNQILEQNRRMTQVQRTDYDKSMLRREIRIEGPMLDVQATNNFQTANSMRHSSGSALVIVRLDTFGRAYVNIPKSGLYTYQYRTKGEMLEIFCIYTSSSERHVSCDIGF